LFLKLFSGCSETKTQHLKLPKKKLIWFAAMAIDVCSEISSAGISPRISFSHDLNQTDVLPNEDRHRRSDLTLLDSGSDFVFCIGSSFVQELSPADELFSNGKIRAKEIKQKVTNPDEIRGSESVSSASLPSRTVNTEKKRLKEFLSSSFDVEEKPPSKSFWQFKRSHYTSCREAIQLVQLRIPNKRRFQRKPRSRICRNNRRCRVESHQHHARVHIIIHIVRHKGLR